MGAIGESVAMALVRWPGRMWMLALVRGRAKLLSLGLHQAPVWMRAWDIACLQLSPGMLLVPVLMLLVACGWLSTC